MFLWLLFYDQGLPPLSFQNALALYSRICHYLSFKDKMLGFKFGISTENEENFFFQTRGPYEENEVCHQQIFSFFLFFGRERAWWSSTENLVQSIEQWLAHTNQREQELEDSGQWKIGSSIFNFSEETEDQSLSEKMMLSMSEISAANPSRVAYPEISAIIRLNSFWTIYSGGGNDQVRNFHDNGSVMIRWAGRVTGNVLI